MLDYAHGGWFESLPNGFFPCVYKGAELGQHGEVALLPWSADVVADEPDHVAVTFSVDARRTPFRLERTLALAGEAPTLRIAEQLTNLADETLHFMWGHHISFGPPFVAEGCQIELPPCRATVPGAPGTVAQTQHARYRPGVTSDWPRLLGVDGREVAADRVPDKAIRTTDSFHLDGFDAGWARLTNPTLGLAVALDWDATLFPFIWCWQNYGGEWGYPYYGRTYSLSLEPFTSPIATLDACVAAGLAPALGPGERLRTEFTFSMLPAA
jgi:galactose mutarotase-like enzyme